MARNFYDTFLKPSTTYKYRNYLVDYGRKMFGVDQYYNTEKAGQNTIDYENYIKSANERALADWHKNVPGRDIKYPEFSFEGNIRRAGLNIANTQLGVQSAYDSMSGSLYGRGLSFYKQHSGLYHVQGKTSRRM